MDLITLDCARPDKVVFHVRRVDGVAEGAAPEVDMVVHGRCLTQLRTNIASAMKICFGQEREFEMLVNTTSDHQQGKDPTSICAGDQIVMIVKPPLGYAGNLGACGAVVSASDDVYVQFEGGLLETYPARLFSTFFVRPPRATA